MPLAGPHPPSPKLAARTQGAAIMPDGGPTFSALIGAARFHTGGPLFVNLIQ